MSKATQLLKRLFRPRSPDAGDYFKRIARYGFGPEAMKQVKVCGVCGKQADCHASKCSYCNADLPDQTLYDFYRLEHRLCRACGTVVSDDAAFCLHCGAPIPPTGTPPQKRRHGKVGAVKHV